MKNCRCFYQGLKMCMFFACNPQIIFVIFSQFELKNLSPSYTVTIQAPIHHNSSLFETDGKIGVHRDASGWKKRNFSINTMSHDAPTVFARFIYGSTTTYDSSATIHHGGATNAHDASTIRYGASTIQAGSATVASRPPTNVHDLVVVMRQS